MYDWNTAKVPKWRGDHPVKVVDETLRDGLQNATAVDPPVAKKIELLQAMQRIGVDVVSVGLPAASKRALEEAVRLTEAIRDAKLGMQPTAAARTVARDVQGVAEVAQRTGMKVEVYAFIGSSPIRHFTEGWDLAFLIDHVREAAACARKEGIPFCLVTEDTTRSRPETLEQVFKTALDEGAARLCLCDTTPRPTASPGWCASRAICSPPPATSTSASTGTRTTIAAWRSRRLCGRARSASTASTGPPSASASAWATAPSSC
jgi:hypothetical protein